MKNNLFYLLIFLMVSQNVLAENPFVTKWKTDNLSTGSSNSTSITIPTTGTGYLYDVDWNNDGTFDNFGVTGNITHDYGTAGIYTVAIRGAFPRICFNNEGDKLKLLSIEQWGDIVWRSMGSAFYGCENFILNATDAPNTEMVTDMSSMFQDCRSFNQALPNSFNTETVTQMANMFRGCSTYNQPLPISFNTSSVTDMSQMFYGCSSYNQPLPTSFNTEKVILMVNMFRGCSTYNQLLPSSFNTEAVIDMTQMFYDCSSYNQPLPSSFNTANVTNMALMFRGCSTYNQPLPSSFNTSAVIDMSQMFRGCSSYNVALPNTFNTEMVKDMSGMFNGCSSYNQALPSSFDTKNVIKMNSMFANCSSFNQPLSNFNTSAVTNMGQMFISCSAYNQILPNSFNTSAVTNMNQMFAGCSSYNQPLPNTFNTSNVTSMNQMFFRCSSYNQPLPSSFNTEKVTDMYFMFCACSSYNQAFPNSFNISAVTNMSFMFYEATAFNQSLANWGAQLNNNVNLTQFLDDCGMNVTNYDATLIGFNAGTVTGRSMGAAGLKYCSASIDRANLVNSTENGGKGWTISGDDISSPCSPEINLKGNGVSIMSNDDTPSLTDYTDFGSQAISSGNVIRTFSIENKGVGVLNLTGTPSRVFIDGIHATDFTVTAAPTSPIAGLTGITTFQVTFNPSDGGLRSARISIANNDPNKDPYFFNIQGTGVCDFTLNAGAINQPTTCGPTGSINFTTTLPSGIYTLNFKKDGKPQTSSFTIGGDETRISAELASGFLLSNVGPGVYSDFSVSFGGCTIVGTGGNKTLAAPNSPAVFSVTGGGAYCAGGPGVLVGLSGSEVGVIYYFKNIENDGKAGTGSAISFGNQKVAGVYTVEAVNTTSNCKTMMTGSATVTVNTGAASGGLIVYNGSPFCANAGTANVTRTAAEGGTYSCETAGLSLNPTTGAVNLAASTPGTYLVRYTLASTCTYVNTTAYITVTAAPTATITYSNSPYCAGSGTAMVTLTGKSGGVFSSTSGLSIDANTGAINLSASTAGSYVVTYTLAAANGCGEFKTTANVSITTKPSATIAYASSPYCANAGTATVTLTGSQGGTFSSTAGLSINANTGAINLAASTAGTYLVTYTVAAANGCAEFKTTANVSITAAPTATIAYSSAPYCANAGTATVTLTGKTGGVFSSTSGLSIDTNTGAINLATSTAGNYVVTYTIAAANGCGEFKTTANVAITTTPSATIAYSNSPYCSNAGTASVTLTGSQGGTFSSTAGLSINANTGAINLATSTAGTYVVTYTIAAANGCSEFKTTANVSITAAPTATIAYSSTPYCANVGTASVTLTGKTGGVFSSTSGLSINANTGVINLATSTAGNYVVTYTIPAANGCSEFKTTANVAITTTPSATIAYANSPYCSNAGTATVTLTGSQGGTFNSTAGLSINANTGAIDLSASTTGTYVVTYTIAAANGCSEFKTTTNVSITAAPTATIAYSSTPYCANAGTASVTLTGKTGGVFSSTSGLNIDANTGAINLAASTAGSYVVTYTFAAANGCGEFKTTANVAITTTPTATIAYANSPYCANAGTASVTLTGSQGGTFSSSAGLSIDANTGAINLAASTAGTYVVTYTIAAANGCAEFKTIANVSITAAPTASLAYSSTLYCANAGTASVTLTGKTGGVFSSTSGLSINASTGEINLATSSAGSYVVTYTLAAANGCGELKATANVTIQAVLVAPSILSNQSSSVCMGTEVLLYTNCPQGSTVLWSNNSTATVLALNANSPSSQILTAKCQQAGACTSAPSEPYKVEWLSTFSLTPINIGQSKSGLKPENSPKSAWSSQYILPDFGPALENSTESNPTIYYSENMNKTAPRYWTIHVETCNLGTAGSLTFNMLSKDESGVERSYNTHENNAPYLMYANRNGFTELYAQNHPAYGFYQDNGSGGNVYDAGLPKGLYKLGIRYWDQKGWGSIFPATRQPAGNVLAYQEFWFRIQSKDGVGKGAARVAAENGQLVKDNGLFAEVMPNPVSSILRLKVTDVKDQKVSVSLMDASGRTLLQRAFTPETNQHQEEFEVSELTNGMYFLKVNAGSKQATLKVVKVQ